MSEPYTGLFVMCVFERGIAIPLNLRFLDENFPCSPLFRMLSLSRRVSWNLLSYSQRFPSALFNQVLCALIHVYVCTGMLAYIVVAVLLKCCTILASLPLLSLPVFQ